MMYIYTYIGSSSVNGMLTKKTVHSIPQSREMVTIAAVQSFALKSYYL